MTDLPEIWRMDRTQRRDGDSARARLMRAKDEHLGWITMNDHMLVNVRLRDEFPQLVRLQHAIRTSNPQIRDGLVEQYRALRWELVPEQESVHNGYLLLRTVIRHLSDHLDDEEALEIGIQAMRLLSDHVQALFNKWLPDARSHS